jgi:hypothetical protein
MNIALWVVIPSAGLNSFSAAQQWYFGHQPALTGTLRQIHDYTIRINGQSFGDYLYDIILDLRNQTRRDITAVMNQYHLKAPFCDGAARLFLPE